MRVSMSPSPNARWNHESHRFLAAVVKLAMVSVCVSGSWVWAASDAENESLLGWSQWGGSWRSARRGLTKEGVRLSQARALAKLRSSAHRERLESWWCAA